MSPACALTPADPLFVAAPPEAGAAHPRFPSQRPDPLRFQPAPSRHQRLPLRPSDGPAARSPDPSRHDHRRFRSRFGRSGCERRRNRGVRVRSQPRLHGPVRGGSRAIRPLAARNHPARRTHSRPFCLRSHGRVPARSPIAIPAASVSTPCIRIPANCGRSAPLGTWTVPPARSSCRLCDTPAAD